MEMPKVFEFVHVVFTQQELYIYKQQFISPVTQFNLDRLKNFLLDNVWNIS